MDVFDASLANPSGVRPDLVLEEAPDFRENIFDVDGKFKEGQCDVCLCRITQGSKKEHWSSNSRGTVRSLTREPKTPAAGVTIDLGAQPDSLR
jgi:hypothetical protein